MTYSIYITQALSILFAFALAKHDGPAVLNFEDKGVDPLQMARFHRYNNWTKFAFCLSSAATGFPSIVDIGFAGLLSFLWIWLVFDPALNKARGKSWDYIGTNDADGRKWVKWFPNRPGEMKFVILLTLILGVNGAVVAGDLL